MHARHSLCSHCLASMELEIEVTNSDASLESWFSSDDTSTGYLEDVIAGWSVWYKQQNLPFYSLSQDQKEIHSLENHCIDLFPPCSSTRTQRLDGKPCLFLLLVFWDQFIPTFLNSIVSIVYFGPMYSYSFLLSIPLL
ncbi:uncharacterized protein LOC129302569 [Prosopis cineraria]|uniref:uncharacterized protein LOC129302569 n=1 Tax=Prosopis cineraria TaxID=364024 RepID=UPI00240EFD2B|nr:uncharacterized protein LOC129302569 [Prosopis cineraria]